MHLSWNGASRRRCALLFGLFICPRNKFFQNRAIGERPATKPTSFFCLFAFPPRVCVCSFSVRDAKTQKRPPPREMLQAVAHCCCVGSLSDRHLTYNRSGCHHFGASFGDHSCSFVQRQARSRRCCCCCCCCCFPGIQVSRCIGWPPTYAKI